MSRLQILVYDERAMQLSAELRMQKLKIKTFDLRIAATVLVGQDILVTRNTRDFKKVPGLTIEDWSV